MMHLHNNYFNLQKKMLFYKKLLRYNNHKIGDKNKIKNYSQVSRKFYHKYM